MLQDQFRYELPKVMCNGNELQCQSNGNGNDYISKKCVMVMKKLQCNGNGNDYFQKKLAPSLFTVT